MICEGSTNVAMGMTTSPFTTVPVCKLDSLRFRRRSNLRLDTLPSLLPETESFNRWEAFNRGFLGEIRPGADSLLGSSWLLLLVPDLLLRLRSPSSAIPSVLRKELAQLWLGDVPSPSLASESCLRNGMAASGGTGLLIRRGDRGMSVPWGSSI
jgi:hypothetical protein